MNNRHLTILSLSFALLYIASCKREDFSFGVAPQINLLETTPLRVKSLKDSISFVLEYLDGDGDLGENAPDLKNLFAEDLRTGLVYGFRLRQLVPGQARVPIKGTLRFSIKHTFITDGTAPERVRYRIYLMDRAGNRSNEVISPEIWVEP